MEQKKAGVDKNTPPLTYKTHKMIEKRRGLDGLLTRRRQHFLAVGSIWLTGCGSHRRFLAWVVTAYSEQHVVVRFAS